MVGPVAGIDPDLVLVEAEKGMTRRRPSGAAAMFILCSTCQPS